MRGSVATINSGILSDVDGLLTAFKLKQSTKLKRGEQLLQLSSIYMMNRRAEPGDNSLLERVFGVYLYSSLSVNLKKIECIKQIRITPSQMRELLQFTEERLRPERHWEAVQCLYNLVNRGAFKVVANCNDRDGMPDGDDDVMIVIDEFPELSEDAVQLCCQVWGGGAEEELFTHGEHPLTRKDLISLCNLNYINDEIINAYLNMIVERSVKEQGLPKAYTFNTFFYANISTKGFTSVKRWTRKVDIFSYDILLIPVHLKLHWTMAIVEVKEKTILYYDSLGVSDHNVLPCIMNYLMEESLDKKKVSLVSSEWKLMAPSDIPHQQNGSDCGVFSCKFADFGSRRCSHVFTQYHMPYYRKRMVFQLCKNDLSAY